MRSLFRPSFRCSPDSAAGLALCALAALALWGVEWALRGWWEPDEARFVQVAHEMAEAGSWLVPLRNGVPYPDKPPLMMWLIRAGEALFPPHFGSRLPLWIGATLSLRAIWSLAARWAGPAAGPRAALILAASWQASVSFGLGQIDGLLLGLELAGLRALFLGRPAAEAGVWLGLAVLAKGPVGALVPLGAFAAARLAEGRRPARAGAARLAGVAALAAVPAVAWLCAARFLADAPADWFRNVLFSQNVARAAGAVGGHRHGPLYFAPYLLTQFLPWTPLLPAAARIMRRRDPILARRLAAWAAFVVAFFSIPLCKRNVYILLSIPPLAIGLAAAWPDALPERLRPRAGAVLAATVALFAVISAAKPLLNAVKESRAIVPLAAQYLPEPEDRLLLVGIHGESLALHAGRRGLRVDKEDETLDAMLVRGRGLAVFPAAAATNLAERFPPTGGRPSGSFRMGRKTYVWTAYEAPATNAVPTATHQ